MRTSRVSMATLAVFAFLVVACGGGDAEDGGGREIDVCSLVTQAEATPF